MWSVSDVAREKNPLSSCCVETNNKHKSVLRATYRPKNTCGTSSQESQNLDNLRDLLGVIVRPSKGRLASCDLSQ
jgi:hypothetical protein